MKVLSCGWYVLSGCISLKSKIFGMDFNIVAAFAHHNLPIGRK